MSSGKTTCVISTAYCTVPNYGTTIVQRRDASCMDSRYGNTPGPEGVETEPTTKQSTTLQYGAEGVINALDIRDARSRPLR